MRSRLITAVVLAAILSLAGCSGTESKDTEGASGTILADLPTTTTSTAPAASAAPAALVVQVEGDAAADSEAVAAQPSTEPGTDTTLADESATSAIAAEATTTVAPVTSTTADASNTTAAEATTTMATTTTIGSTTEAPTTTVAPTTTAPPSTAAGGTETRDEILRLALPKHGGGSFNPDSVAGKNVILWFWGAH